MEGKKIKKENQIIQGSKTADAIFFIIAVLICIVTIYPMYYVLIMSISDPLEVAAMKVSIIPRNVYLGSYKIIMQNEKMWRAYMNTIIYVFSGTFLNCLTALMGAYPLAAKNLFARKYVIKFIIIPMYFGGGLIPTFLLMSRIGLYNNMLAIIIPGAVSIWSIILTRTFFISLPEALKESATIDGANNFDVLFRIYFPLSKPIIAVVAIYSMVGIWNSWFNAMVYLPNEKLHPLQMYLKRVLVEESVDLSSLSVQDQEEALANLLTNKQLKYTMIIFTSLPIIFAYPFFQKYFIKGAMLGSLKE